ncbi:2-isopropylmalate synthase [Caldivirga maquilingensis]|uniref:2-isopropylmalate synthase n=1 Tax=Caldivirga maquilingensis (strain ATCC 700844 / DSM 13496 / JCM 10307 / IC-167) TaxID=397948 RepID=A8MDZ2_CALMQ|nr:2-isopropylmalate synthase [Caldivirga maquilingensis]ABW01998.1 isopropylmalate/citramalate/homocitrate synthase [Caldivirga maquilingensis IC-167]
MVWIAQEMIQSPVKETGVRYVRFLDTTLRDGEQTPGVALRPEEKLIIAMKLEDLGVDSIEAGYPSVSEGEFKSVKMISKEITESEVIALSRSNKADIDKAIDADVKAVHLFIATSDIHMKYKLRMSRSQVIETAVNAVEYAKSHGLTVEFSAEDATRSDLDFLINVFQSVVNAGADRLDIADTVGVMWPSRIMNLVKVIKSNVKGNYLLSVHCHDDFGMAVANSVAAIEAGADQAHGTINGVGERAGNAALEEIASAVKFLLGYDTRIRFNKIKDVSDTVSRFFKIPVPPNKAIVGANAFSHESGIHVHGILSNPQTYEPIDPTMVGMSRRIVLGKHSGRHSVEYALKMMGIEPSNELVMRILHRIKQLGDSGSSLTWEDFKRIVLMEINSESA